MKNQSGSAIVNLEQPPKMGIKKINPIKGDLPFQSGFYSQAR